MAVMSLIASLAVIAIVVWLLFHLIGSIIKVIIITIILIALAYFVFGWNFGLGSMLGMVMGHTDVSTEGVTVSFFDKTETVNVTRVIDGDTLEIGSLGRRYRIRLHGVDAPELSQPHGNASKDWLNENFNKAEIEWQSVGVDLYGRRLGIVYKDKNSVNRELVANGYAWVYPGTKIDFERLKAAEDAAFSKRVGLWGKQNPVAPWIWRKESHR